MKKITACAMCMAAATGMMLGSTAMAADYNGHWAEKQIQEFIDNGYLVGYPDGSFKPSNTITRAEIATVVNQMMGYTEKADISNYTDLNKDSWYYKQIETIVKSKVMVGLNDTKWDPNGNVTREQVCVMVCELNNIAVESTDKNDELRAQLKAKGYTDVDNISDWAVPYVAATVEKGYMVGYADDMTLRTKNPITRAEAVTLLKECVPEQDQSVYVMMNIPYDEFYASDVRNDTKVDVFSSATKSKTRTGTLAGGSYHVNSDGSQIDGISFPVKINKSALADKKQVTDDDSVEITVTNRGQTNTTTYTGVDALFENETYAYYALSETPEYYKEATVNEDGSISFGKIQGTAQKVEGATADLMTSSSYGDYELVIDGFDKIDTSTDKVYGVIISTDENDYGLRHLENIWRVTDLAWCTGFTDAVHNCPTDSEHYKSMMGQTIQKVTYYTSKGIYEIPMEVYVPVKFEGSVAVESAMVSDGETTVTLPEMPKDYEAEYSVKGLDGAKVENGKLTYSKDAKNGRYTLTVSDKSGKYADLTATFELKVDAPAKAADDSMSVVKSGDTVTDDAFAAYIKAVSSVTINGTKYAASGRGATIVVNEDGSITIPDKAEAKDGKYEVVISATGYTDVTVTVPETVYLYASLSYAEYWANEGVYAAGDTTSSDVKDSREETDKGAYDAVSRATQNHGLHRGSFQQDVVIHTESGTDYVPVSWTDGNNFVAEDGKTYNKANIGITGYEITGIKYVPVAVSSKDYAQFVKDYDVTKNGETLEGGYSENQLAAYTCTAAVDANTNGLKTATYTDGTWSFGARQTGTGSGIKDAELAKAENAQSMVNDQPGNYGEFLRVDIKGDYGALGGAMQTVQWTYYGDDSTYTTPVATYGTKFAADNWMHRSNGIQLGLTESLRCQLPEGTDGTGYWKVTVYALGYADYETTIAVTADDLATEQLPMTAEQKTQLADLMAQAKALLDSEYAVKDSAAYADLSAHYTEAEAATTMAQAAELIGELPDKIAAVQAEVTANMPVIKTGTATVDPTNYPDYNEYGADFDAYQIKVDVSVKDNVITAIELNPECSIASDNQKYMTKALKKAQTEYIGKNFTEPSGKLDAVSSATCSTNAVASAVLNALWS